MEYSCTLLKFPDLVGSPPLTRGILILKYCSCFAYRFTPAHAGNTRHGSRTTIQMEVHPRSRGEYTVEEVFQSHKSGSPPLTRGIPGNIKTLGGATRFTPAHAGNTLPHLPDRRLSQVHPRSRGEYSFLQGAVEAIVGSPPLTRGIR